MDLGLAGKKALVTGSTKGIGRAIAETLIGEGASVAICSRTQDDVDTAVSELNEVAHSIGGTACGGTVDAADLNSLEAWIASSADTLGGIDIYVHNTSGKPQKQIEDWIKNYEIDLRALVGGVAAAKDSLIDGGGALISIGTTAAAEHFGSGSGSYSAFKAAVTNWTLGQAQVLGAQGVRCNVVSPGPIFVEGGDWDNIKSARPEIYEATEAAHPSGSIGTAQDVANVVTFLASEAARHVNGANVTVDGGFLKRINY
ncbi:MAG: SDR family oxidoreductase [Acidimicrobiales bacterium]|nr:SDR family oxidoreductase [Acidimicrobiales bacterium]